MSTAAVAFYDHEERAGLARWGTAAAVVLAAHVGFVAAYQLIDWPKVLPPQEAPAIMIELAPVTAAPSSPNDAAPGPETVQSQQAAPLPTPREMQNEIIEPLPKVQTPAVVTLPDLKPIEQNPEQKPLEDKKPEVVREKKSQAAQTTSAPRAERPPSPVARAPSPGINPNRATASLSWISQVTAHINRHKRYPPEARGAQGTVAVSFSVSRSGQILSRRVARSSGVAALDAEALAALARAQPLPAFPSEMAGGSISVTAPFVFVVR
jgi:protein TonB